MKFIQRLELYLSISAAMIAVIIYGSFRIYKSEYKYDLSFWKALPLIFNNSFNNFFNSQILPINSKILITALFYFVIVFAFFYLIFSFIEYLTLVPEKRRINSALQHYVTPFLAKTVIQNPEKVILGGKSAHLSVFFADVADFSRWLHEYRPQKVIECLNEYFTEMSKPILELEGTIDKYEGDAIMAFWGAPQPQGDHAIRACKTALMCQKRIKTLNKEWKKKNNPNLKCDIAVATGKMIVGNIGSPGYFNYTVIGEEVNMCFEIEKLNNHFNIDILVSEETYHETKHYFEFREITEVTFKSSLTLRIFELLAEKGCLSPNDFELRDMYHESLEQYREKKYKNAQKAINNCLRISSNDRPSQLLKIDIEKMI